ncbi:hypothetical protein [Arthrobacter sp.]|uniref:hypothetical protein n=1 Tax=Arthrobacter sp. TaxID=1667 RepID=UPI003395EA4A
MLHRPAPGMQRGPDLPPTGPNPTLLTCLRPTYPGARLSMSGNGNVRVELSGGDVLRFYVEG